MDKGYMKITFIQPKTGFNGHTWESIGIGYIASYLKSVRDDLDLNFFSAFYDDDASIVRGACNSDIVSFSCTSPQFRHGIYLASKLKELNPDIKIVFGGAHVSALPLKYPLVDHVVVGEGEQSVSRIVNGVSSYVVSSPYIQELDNIPFPDRTLINNERNIRQAYNDTGMRITSIVSSRGCPFKCKFCGSNAIWGRNTRFRTPRNILHEMEDIWKEYSLDFIKFSDDTFTIDKARIMEFCKIKVEMGIDVPFGANAHVNTMDEEIIRELKNSGCEELWFGVESGSPKVLKSMNKSSNLDKIKNIFKISHDYGVKTRAYIVLGFPGETKEDILCTEALIDDIQPDYVGFTIFTPYPGSYYYNDHLSNVDWSMIDTYGGNIICNKQVGCDYLISEKNRLASKYIDRLVYRSLQVLNANSNV